MKLENVKVGMDVLVKRKFSSDFFVYNRGKIGFVTDLTPDDDDLNVRVKFEDGRYNWGHYKDLKRVKEQSQ